MYYIIITMCLSSELKRGVEVGEEGMGGVFGRENHFGGVDLPVYAERGVGNGDSAVGFGGIEVVTFILEYGYVALDRESVGESSGDEELEVVFVVEFDGDVSAERGRAFADVDGDVDD